MNSANVELNSATAGLKPANAGGKKRLRRAPLRQDGYGKWTQVDDMPLARMACGCCIYRGKVVLLGGAGNGGVILKSVDVWDPESARWLPESAAERIPNMPEARKVGRMQPCCV
jgi:hypothetical protein